MRLALAILVVATAPVIADPRRDRPRDVCLIGAPKHACTTIPVVDAGLGLGRTGEGSVAGSALLPLQVGWLVNLTERNAVGATVGAVFYDHAMPDRPGLAGSFGGFVRYRRWLCEWCSLDVSLGAASGGPIAEIAFQAHDMVALTGGMHAFQIDDRREVAMTVGFRVSGIMLAALGALALEVASP